MVLPSVSFDTSLGHLETTSVSRLEDFPGAVLQNFAKRAQDPAQSPLANGILFKLGIDGSHTRTLNAVILFEGWLG
jgi:hypothetical protein